MRKHRSNRMGNFQQFDDDWIFFLRKMAVVLTFFISYFCYKIFILFLCCQVAMGQGQAEVAMQLLHECATNGEWLCLKNLHLVTAWLPALEKVSTFITPNFFFCIFIFATHYEQRLI